MSEIPPDTASQTPHPATEKGLARLKELVRGNGIDPDKISIVSTDEETYTVHATMDLSPAWDVQEISAKQAKSGFVKKLRTMNDVNTLKSASWPTRWLEEVHDELKGLPGKGWGLDQKRIALSAHSTIYGVDEGCRNCHGRGTVNCNHCHGRGFIICSKCYGAGKNPQNHHEDCKDCHGRREIPCPDCKEGQVACSICHRTGQITRYFSQKFYADSSFGWNGGSELPSELLRCIDRAGLAKLAGGHATITQGKPTENSTRLKYNATLPFAQVKFGIDGQTFKALVLGNKSALLEMKPFFDPIVETHEKEGSLDKLRLFADAQKLAAKQQKADALLHLYPAGLSKGTAQKIAVKARRSLYVATRRERWLSLAALSLLSGLIIYAWFTYDWRSIFGRIPLPLAIWDFLLLPVLFFVTARLAGFVESYKLCKVFGVKGARSQFWRLDLVPVAIALTGFFMLYVFTGPVAPDWYASSIIDRQISERERSMDPPNED